MTSIQGMQKKSDWKDVRRSIRAGKFICQFANSSIPNVYVMEMVSKDSTQIYGWVWYSFETGNVLSICQSYVPFQLRRCGVRTHMHNQLIKSFPGIRMMVTGRASKHSLPWMRKQGFIFHQELDRWECKVNQNIHIIPSSS